jgi:hypothetical protein
LLWKQNCHGAGTAAAGDGVDGDSYVQAFEDWRG